MQLRATFRAIKKDLIPGAERDEVLLHFNSVVKNWRLSYELGTAPDEFSDN